MVKKCCNTFNRTLGLMKIFTETESMFQGCSFLLQKLKLFINLKKKPLELISFIENSREVLFIKFSLHWNYQKRQKRKFPAFETL